MLTATILVAAVVLAGIGIDELTRWRENRSNLLGHLIDGDTWAEQSGYGLPHLDETTPIYDGLCWDRWEDDCA